MAEPAASTPVAAPAAEVDEVDEDGSEDGAHANANTWLPPGADCAGDETTLYDTLEEHFWLPERLATKTSSLVEAVNDFHFAMLNDHDRNSFYKKALTEAVKPTDIVLEIGTGSGLLAMMSAQAGAEHVYAVEANRDLTALAQKLIKQNDLDKKITVINKLSTHVKVGEDIPRKANVLVSEILGTLLLGESALAFVSECRQRHLAPGATIIPAAGSQFISLIQSEEIASITSVGAVENINLDGFDALQDTVNVVFTKQYGFRLSSVDYKTIVPRVCVAEVDFYEDNPGSLPLEKRIHVTCEKSGTIHCVMLFWEAYADRERTQVMSTDPEATRDNFPRDMQWGQALQLVEDASKNEIRPVPLVVKEGDELEIIVRFSADSAVMQFQVMPA